ncbi:hypothetical protein B296_00024417 [Ensete ventricosum]|uniref:Uncharacterized protein n=1 Tax=Ensete ventricosum TaxID=4639 RepID=A0A426YHY5_ENSVE|nr:hypothetical protein B296_00024417 [Ensete ventricosum]
MEDRLRVLFTEFGSSRPPSPTKFQQDESSERPHKKEERATDMMQSRMRVNFPRRKKTRRDVNHLEGDAIWWYNWLEYTHGAPTFVSTLRVCLCILHLLGPFHNQALSLHESKGSMTPRKSHLCNTNTLLCP